MIFSEGLEDRIKVSKLIWPYMLSIGLAYFVTLCLYPGIEAEITSCNFGTWMPVLIMAVFNGADLLGKVNAQINAAQRKKTLNLENLHRF
jgi:solute carrier family 29 (equilibrative nucleoside transporter), member 4